MMVTPHYLPLPPIIKALKRRRPRPHSSRKVNIESAGANLNRNEAGYQLIPAVLEAKGPLSVFTIAETGKNDVKKTTKYYQKGSFWKYHVQKATKTAWRGTFKRKE
jgi:hypothetical protein